MQIKKRIDLYCSIRTGAVIIVIGLLFLSLGAVQATSPPTYQTTVQDGTTSFNTQASYYSETVDTDNSSLYERPENRTNAQLYFTQYHKELVISPSFSKEPESVTTEVELIATPTRSTTVVWSKQVQSGTVYTQNNSTVTVQIDSMLREMSKVNDELPSGLDVQLRVYHTAKYAYQDDVFSQTAKTTIQTSNIDSYQVQMDGVSETKSDIETIERAEPARTTELGGTPYSNIGLAIVLSGLLTIGFGVYLIYGAKFDNRTYEERLYEYHLEKYSSWITDGRPLNDPEFTSDEVNKVVVETLEGLVHISIDTKTRVIYSDELRRFYVFSDETLYTFNPANIGNNIDTHDAATEAILNP